MSLTALDVMTSAEVGELLKEPVKTVEAWARAGLIPGHKIGKRWKFIRAEVESTLLSAAGGRSRAAA
jgi:excisionase family DNA binding protein